MVREVRKAAAASMRGEAYFTREARQHVLHLQDVLAIRVAAAQQRALEEEVESSDSDKDEQEQEEEEEEEELESHKQGYSSRYTAVLALGPLTGLVDPEEQE